MMRLPRPASPRALWRDLRLFLGERRPHQWIAAVLAVSIPTIIGVAFVLDNRDAHDIGPQLIMVESWSADRSIDEIRAKQEADQALRNEALAERQRQFQRLENRLGL